MIKPLNGYVLLKPVEQTESQIGAIFIPDLGKERPETAIVMDTSSTYNFHTDKLVSSVLEAGQTVMLPKLGTAKVSFEGVDYYLCKETEIMGVIN
jgi:co-chaperonin GroES (HSP10)